MPRDLTNETRDSNTPPVAIADDQPARQSVGLAEPLRRRQHQHGHYRDPRMPLRRRLRADPPEHRRSGSCPRPRPDARDLRTHSTRSTRRSLASLAASDLVTLGGAYANHERRRLDTVPRFGAPRGLPAKSGPALPCYNRESRLRAWSGSGRRIQLARRAAASRPRRKLQAAGRRRRRACVTDPGAEAVTRPR